MLSILINGEPRDVTADTTVHDLLDQAGYGGRKIAVEINREIVPRSVHMERLLQAGDRIEIVHAMGGG